MFNEEDALPAPASPDTTTTTSSLTAPPVTAGSTNRQQKPEGGAGPQATGTESAAAQKASGAEAAAGQKSSSRGNKRSRRGSRGDDNRVSADGDRPVPNDARAAAILPQRGGDNVKRAESFGDVVDRAVATGSPELRAFAQTRMGSALIDR